MSNATHNALLTTFSVANAAYAVAMLVSPSSFISLFGVSPDVPSVWLARMLGTAILGLGALAFFARRIDDIESRRALDAGFLVSTAGGLGIALWAEYVGVFNAVGWVNVVILAAFSVGLFWFLAGEDRLADLVKPRPSG